MLPEQDVEQRLIDRIKAQGGDCYKFVSPGWAGMPDRLVLLPVPLEHQEIVARYVQFVETKAPNGKARPLQAVRIERLRELGYKAGVLNR